MKFEYSCFTMEFNVAGAPTPYADWPRIAWQDAQIKVMNELGADGWEIFERVWGPHKEDGETRKCNLWARRRIE